MGGAKSSRLWTEVEENRVEVMRSWQENQSDEPRLVGAKMLSKRGWKRTGWMDGDSAGRDESGVHEKTDSGESAFGCSVSVLCQDRIVDLDAACGSSPSGWPLAFSGRMISVEVAWVG